MIELSCWLPSKSLQHDMLVVTVVEVVFLVLFIVWAIGWQAYDKDGVE